MLKKINYILTKEFLNVSKTINIVLDQQIHKREIFFKLVQDAKKSVKNNSKIIFLGNGGSAADAQHLAAELVVKYKKKRKAIPAIAITTDTSTLTAIGNDFSFKEIFSRQLEAVVRKGDTVIMLTTSGNSPNILESIKFLKKKNINFFVIAGNKGGKASRLTKKILTIPSKETSVIQNLHMMYGHVLCEILEKS